MISPPIFPTSRQLPRLATFRGAYSGDSVNPGWQPALAIMP